MMAEAEADTYVGRLREMLEVTERIRSTAHAGDWDGMLASLEERQALMSRMDQLPSEARQPTGQDHAAATRLLEHLVQQDLEIAQKVAEAMAATKLAVGENQLARATVSAYRRAANPGVQVALARFVDKQR